MRKLNKLKAAMTLTSKDFAAAIGDKKVEKLTLMLQNNLYAFRVKHYLFKDKKISPKGFLYNDNIYNLPIGKKDVSGDILIDNGILDIFDRYMFSEDLASKGDALTAFIVDHDDFLYKVLKTNTAADNKMTDAEYIGIFSAAYNRCSDIILNDKINVIMEEDVELFNTLLEVKHKNNTDD